MKNLTLILVFLTSTLVVSAQESIYIYGKVVRGSQPVFSATIINMTNGKGTVTDNYGDFSMWVNKNDILKFSSIGYKTVLYTVPDTLNEQKFRILVNMVEDTFLLKEAVVVPWPVNRSMLKKAMLDNKKEKDQISAFAGFVRNDAPVREPEPRLTNPISFIYDKFSKKARQQKKMEKYRQMIEQGERIGTTPEKPIQY